jgi:hypothetical protein
MMNSPRKSTGEHLHVSCNALCDFARDVRPLTEREAAHIDECQECRSALVTVLHAFFRSSKIQRLSARAQAA